MGKLSKKKSGWKPLEIPIAIPKDTASKTEIMDNKESFKYTSWAMERKSADKILTNVKKTGFNVKLDDLHKFQAMSKIFRVFAILSDSPA